MIPSFEFQEKSPREPRIWTGTSTISSWYSIWGTSICFCTVWTMGTWTCLATGTCHHLILVLHLAGDGKSAALLAKSSTTHIQYPVREGRPMESVIDFHKSPKTEVLSKPLSKSSETTWAKPRQIQHFGKKEKLRRKCSDSHTATFWIIKDVSFHFL